MWTRARKAYRKSMDALSKIESPLAYGMPAQIDAKPGLQSCRPVASTAAGEARSRLQQHLRESTASSSTSADHHEHADSPLEEDLQRQGKHDAHGPSWKFQSATLHGLMCARSQNRIRCKLYDCDSTDAGFGIEQTGKRGTVWDVESFNRLGGPTHLHSRPLLRLHGRKPAPVAPAR